ncbi:MAG: hypothetical protein SFV21_04640 [Rhodospirillaceae bacterium]|nr:hypothetical protein [Rhodospirillaceae bacterium]
MQQSLPYALSFAIAAVVLAGARLAAGPERWLRLAAPALALGFGAGWALALAPGWIAFDAVSRLGHIALGAALLGLALDWLWPPAALRRGLIAAFVLGCAALSVMGGLAWPSALRDVAAIAALAVVWLVVVLRLISVQGHPPTGLVMLFAAVAAVAAAAAALDDRAVLVTAALVALALVPAAVAALTVAAGVTPGASLVAAALVAGCAWALAERHPGAGPGLAVLLFLVFADRTAQRVPLPAGGISAILYVLVLIGCAALPIAIAVPLILAGASD